MGQGPFFTYLVFKSLIWNPLADDDWWKKRLSMHLVAPVYASICSRHMLAHPQSHIAKLMGWKSIRAEVPCLQVVDMAKSAFRDAKGTGSAVAHCGVIRKVANINNRNAEERIHPILEDFGLTLPIPISRITENLHCEGLPRWSR